MSFYDGDNAKVFYEVKASLAAHASWVTLINGYTRSSSDFKMMAEYLSQQGHHVLMFDNRGSGQTESKGEFDLSQVTDDILGIWKKENILSSHVIGLSMGGFIAQILAVSNPAKLRSLILVSTSQRINELVRPQLWGVDKERISERLSAYFHPLFAKKNPILIKAMAKKMAFDNQDGRLDKMATQQRTAMASTVGIGNKLHSILLPVLVCHGDDDSVVSLDEAKSLVQAIPGAKLKIFTECGHLLLAEKGKEFYQECANFIRSSEHFE